MSRHWEPGTRHVRGFSFINRWLNYGEAPMTHHRVYAPRNWGKPIENKNTYNFRFFFFYVFSCKYLCMGVGSSSPLTMIECSFFSFLLHWLDRMEDIVCFSSIIDKINLNKFNCHWFLSRVVIVINTEHLSTLKNTSKNFETGAEIKHSINSLSIEKKKKLRVRKWLTWEISVIFDYYWMS